MLETVDKRDRFAILLGALLEQSASPLRVARLDVEGEALGLEGGVKRVCGGRHFEEGLCVLCVVCCVVKS